MNEQDTPELLPCPHCGNDAAVSHRPNGFGQRPNGFRVACKSRFTTCPVNSRTHHAKTEQEAIAAWNTRPAMPDTTAQAATVTPQKAAKVLFDDAVVESEKAMRKFPQPNYVISKVAEEAGEVVKAAIHCAEGRETAENVRSEIVQCMAMLIRLYIEGDEVHGLGPISKESA